jgi:2,4-diaminopentanoate dehydrogenase
MIKDGNGSPPIRIVQWTTGNVGKQSVEAVMKRPDLELVGCYAWSEKKSGQDVGELCGLPPIGLAATHDIDALLALQPDCVIYNPMWFDVDEMVRILNSGANIVATAAFINGRSYPDDGRQRILDACTQGGSSIFGSGVSPGYVELVTVALANASDRIDHVLISEEADTTAYDSPPTEIPVGFGRPLDDPALPGMTAGATVVFSEAVALVGDALGVVFDEIVCEAEYAKTTKELDLGSWTLAKDTVAGVTIHWLGKIGGRSIVEMRVRWRKGDALEPDWDVGMGWTIEIQGRPTITTKIDILPPPYFEATTMEEFMVLGHILTALPVVNAIPAVVAAPPGIVTYEDIPVPLPKGYVPTF